jgi:hypothetical protein
LIGLGARLALGGLLTTLVGSALAPLYASVFESLIPTPVKNVITSLRNPAAWLFGVSFTGLAGFKRVGGVAAEAGYELLMSPRTPENLATYFYYPDIDSDQGHYFTGVSLDHQGGASYGPLAANGSIAVKVGFVFGPNTAGDYKGSFTSISLPLAKTSARLRRAILARATEGIQSYVPRFNETVAFRFNRYVDRIEYPSVRNAIRQNLQAIENAFNAVQNWLSRQFDRLSVSFFWDPDKQASVGASLSYRVIGDSGNYSYINTFYEMAWPFDDERTPF